MCCHDAHFRLMGLMPSRCFDSERRGLELRCSHDLALPVLCGASLPAGSTCASGRMAKAIAFQERTGTRCESDRVVSRPHDMIVPFLCRHTWLARSTSIASRD
jgi:hypothetical protein